MARNIDVQAIAQAMASLELRDYGDVLQCMRCGSCLPTCPTYRTDGLETQSPRGRVAMIRAVMDGRLAPTEEFVAHMYHCLDCRNCQTVCPAGVKVGELVLEARHRIEKCLPQPLVKRFILQSAIRDQKRLWRYLAPLRLYQRSGLQNVIRQSRVLAWLSSNLEFMEALLPPLPSQPLSETIPDVIPAQGKEKGRVGFFLGCAMNLLFVSISRDTIEVLTRFGYTVVVPKGQQCCGTPNIAEGERTVYREMAEHNIALFEDKAVDAIVCDCAACGMELKAYGETLAPVTRIASRAEVFSRKVKDVSEFLVQGLSEPVPFGAISERVCFHDPCHLRHGQKVVTPQRILLRRIPELELVDIPDEGQCCGSAGIYNITHHERAMKILAAKVDAIDKTGAIRVVTSNPGCLMQLDYARRHWNKDWHVSHLSQVLRQALEQGERVKKSRSS